MAKTEMRVWAVKGAEQRLREIDEETRAIYSAFPELRRQGRGTSAGRPSRGSRRATDTSENEARPRRKRKMSREGRRRISEAQKARWAKQKAAQGAEAASTAAPAAKKQGAARKKK